MLVSGRILTPDLCLTYRELDSGGAAAVSCCAPAEGPADSGNSPAAWSEEGDALSCPLCYLEEALAKSVPGVAQVWAAPVVIPPRTQSPPDRLNPPQLYGGHARAPPASPRV